MSSEEYSSSTFCRCVSWQKELEDNTPNMLEWFLGNAKLITTTKPKKTKPVFSSTFSPGTFSFPVLLSGICGYLMTCQTSLCVRLQWAGCPLCYPRSNFWLLIFFPQPSALSSSLSTRGFFFFYAFEENSSSVQFFGYIAALDGCRVALCIDRHLRGNWGSSLLAIRPLWGQSMVLPQSGFPLRKSCG